MVSIKLFYFRKLFEQDQIHTQIDRTIQAYDDEVKESQEQKIDVIVSSKVQELHLLSLHQELIIIKEFEATEDNLSQNVLEKTEEKSGMLAKVTKIIFSTRMFHLLYIIIISCNKCMSRSLLIFLRLCKSVYRRLLLRMTLNNSSLLMTDG